MKDTKNIERLQKISNMLEELEPEDQKFVAGVIQGLTYRKIVEQKGD